MPKLKDITGQKFGRLVVVDRAPNKGKVVMWNAVCDCGTKITTQGGALRSGHTKSCGCLQKEKVGQNFIDETGNKYGRLTVKKRAENSKKGQARWECECDCGNTTVADGAQLRNGKWKSCGCLQKEACSTASTKDETGNRYGLLTVISKSNLRATNGEVIWNCVCDCGQKTEVYGTNLRRNNTLSCGCLKSKGELIIQKLLEKFKIHYKKEYTFDKLKSDTNTHLRFDFAVFKDNKLSHLIEYDGPQHYDKEDRWYSEKIVKHDKLKNEYCKRNKIKLLRFRSYKNLTIEDLI